MANKIIKPIANHCIFILFACALFYFPTKIFATHIIGGEITYKCLGNNKFIISLTVYRDCKNGSPSAPFDDPAYLGFFLQNNQLDTTIASKGVLNLYLRNNDTLAPILFSPCRVQKDSICVHTTTYFDTVSLPFRPGGYRLVYQRCCRNGSIVNIQEPIGTGATFSTDITEHALMNCNSSPTFKEWPPLYICVDDPIVFDHSGVDVEGDSIVYELCVPLNGPPPDLPQPNPPGNPPYPEVVWKSPFSLSNVLSGVPLMIDRQTGLLTGTPNVLGQFVVGICMKEYRLGILQSIVRRDFQYNVGLCGTVSAVYTAPLFQCSKTIFIENDSSVANTFEWILTDSMGLTTRQYNRSFNFDVPKEGTYYIRLVANPNFDCADTAYHQIHIYDEKITPNFTYEIVQCNADSILIKVVNNPSIENDTIQWMKTQIGFDNSVVSFFNQDTILVSLKRVTDIDIFQEIGSSKGCYDSLSKKINLPLLDSDYPSILSLCENNTLIVRPDKILPCNYTWTPTTYITTSPFEAVVGISPESSIQYIVKMVGLNDVCVAYDTVNVVLIPKVLDLAINALPDEIRKGANSTLTATFLNNYTYIWSPQQSLSSFNLNTAIANPTVSTRYFVTITSPDGCVDTTSIVLRVLVDPCSEPYLFIPNAFSPNGDGENDQWQVKGNAVISCIVSIFDRWGHLVYHSESGIPSWDGRFQGQDLPPDVYGYYLKIICEDQTTTQRQGNITLVR
jgi:gliding motility-associated-like protein